MRNFFYLTFLGIGLLLCCLVGSAQERTITGTVLSSDGNTKTPLVGATITVKNTNRVTQTDNDGRFSIQAAAGESLVITHVGYEPQEMKVNKSAALAITMRVPANNLNEVVVTALGIKKE